ncbi:hypothetical protein [Nonomuraea pusilla]|uniref:Uncharacterized protein n=1 Tax=Nonomuraea pusilla TaxID=46177 RepID=A0A1H8GJ89_9ACTN|nr:hypothetical protein [Nonomuraea pusilla]SEN43378.1 hypothetical protein SAMN05660976_07565 [Nonomuraea pusilla]
MRVRSSTKKSGKNLPGRDVPARKQVPMPRMPQRPVAPPRRIPSKGR